MVRKTTVIEKPAYTLVSLAAYLKVDPDQLKIMLQDEFKFSASNDFDLIPEAISDKLISPSQASIVKSAEPAPSEESINEGITAGNLANQLGIDFQELQSLIVSEYHLTIESADEVVPNFLADKLLNIGKELVEKNPSLQPAADPEEETPISQLSLRDASTIAASHQTSLQTVISLHNSLRLRREEIALQEGYVGMQRELAIEGVGRSLAMINHYDQQRQELDQVQKTLDSKELSVAAIAQELGIDLNEILDNQTKQEVAHMEGVQRKATLVEGLTPEQLKSKELSNEIVELGSLEVMKAQLRELGKRSEL
jgi:hypothetical protein